MQNTYQDLITEIHSKNPAISEKLEGEKSSKLNLILNLLVISQMQLKN
jgi:hypothetical protein